MGSPKGKSVQLVSIDNYRIGGADQLRSFAGILGVGFQAFETVLGLDAAIDEVRAKDLVFIDTPGFSASTWEESAELRSWLASHPRVDTHLVVPASMNAADLQQVIDRFQVFRPAKLLFTRLTRPPPGGPSSPNHSHGDPAVVPFHGTVDPRGYRTGRARKTRQGLAGNHEGAGQGSGGLGSIHRNGYARIRVHCKDTKTARP